MVQENKKKNEIYDIIKEKKKMNKVKEFLIEYIMCEVIVKDYIYKYKRQNGIEIKKEEIEMKYQTINSSLNYFGITPKKELLLKIFSSNDNISNKISYKKMRDRIVHGFNKKVINKINTNYNEYMNNMKELLDML